MKREPREFLIVVLIFGLIFILNFTAFHDNALEVFSYLTPLRTSWVDIEESEEPPNRTEPPKLLLSYTAFFSGTLWDFIDRNSEQFCDYKCIYSDNASLLEHASMVLFHGKNINLQNPNPLPKLSSNQLTVYAIWESPIHTYDIQKLPKKYFDFFLSYRSDSDVVMPYDSFREFDENAEISMNYTIWDQEQVQDIVANKSELILQFVSNCDTNSKRERYVRKMRDHVNVTVVGGCKDSTAKCGRDSSCEAELIKSHYFYLAFEVTEKFFRMKELIVPIVLKRSIVEGIAPNGSFIAVDDFKSPEELVKFLEDTAAEP
ncbi:hypothetical protein L596_030002 [Steinernema carpocapsae]|uniref:Fucosyltransferase n=1 Tax=Steinernema carpocapsae TaxID=34508 RepID=A0A4U5LRG0_STECR|nr:hypothetical protein L596_030002 [Steinernema carpocapsae]